MLISLFPVHVSVSGSKAQKSVTLSELFSPLPHRRCRLSQRLMLPCAWSRRYWLSVSSCRTLRHISRNPSGGCRHSRTPHIRTGPSRTRPHTSWPPAVKVTAEHLDTPSKSDTFTQLPTRSSSSSIEHDGRIHAATQTDQKDRIVLLIAFMPKKFLNPRQKYQDIPPAAKKFDRHSRQGH